MATAARELIELNAIPVQQGGLTAVILDGGDTVRVALIRFPAPPEVGDLLTFEGRAYEIVRAKDHARGFVARPVAETAS